MAVEEIKKLKRITDMMKLEISANPILITGPKPFHNQTISITSWPEKISAATADNLAFPYPQHLKPYSPQMPMPDNEMIAVIFPGKAIIVDHGK